MRITSSLIPGIATLIAWILVLAGQSSDNQSDMVVDDKPRYSKLKNQKAIKQQPDLNISMQAVL